MENHQNKTLYIMDNLNNAQAEALNLSLSLERLATSMDTAQYGRLEGFVQQALAMFDAMKEGWGA